MKNYTNGEIMYDLTDKDVLITFGYAVLRTFLSVGWFYLWMSNIIDGNRILCAVYGLIAGNYTYVTIQWWKRWWRERKLLIEQRKAEEVDG